MAYQVVLADSAKTDAAEIYEWVIEQAPLKGPEWFDGLIDCLSSLVELPFRCPSAREAVKAGRDIRCLVYGKRKHSYRILFEVDEDRRTVWILHIRHGALRDLEPETLNHPRVT